MTDGNDIFNLVAAQSQSGDAFVKRLLAEIQQHFLFLGEDEQVFVAGIESCVELMSAIPQKDVQRLQQLVLLLRRRVHEANGPIR